MSRGQSNPSGIFSDVLKSAAQELRINFNKATSFQHSVIKGDERAGYLNGFLKKHLPASIGVGKGEVIDVYDKRSGQLDLIIYEKSVSGSILLGEENVLLPCESLYVTIEVKSCLNKGEIEKAILASKKVKSLQPFKTGRFIKPRITGQAFSNDEHRCLYILFAFSTDLIAETWLKNEYKRLCQAGSDLESDIELIDRIVVLDRGIINPSSKTGKVYHTDEKEEAFLEFYVHMLNFLRKEMERRPSVDWQQYTYKMSQNWEKLI